MAREKMFDPGFQKVFTEAIHKEKQLRMKWNKQYGSQFQRSQAVRWDEDPDEDSSEEISTSVGYEMPSKDERAWPRSKAPLSDTIPRISQPPEVMRPVSPDSRKVLYQGLSHDGEGRAQYLKHRYENSPEERYHYPICSSWEYGWTYGREPELSCPKHGRS